ncbi:hypothetical protein SPHINGO391_450137 [Sphingomonas aurantiaca]|uniref:Uncharacterized protein n=1 Tax=Sphingomonas aurantiaca TaxID=185949 RepID=A0A5E7ZF41_9SPHN|nr:hypothetical protein SPHINGO391_450137 [Sphingomonas aurantiaca]
MRYPDPYPHLIGYRVIYRQPHLGYEAR